MKMRRIKFAKRLLACGLATLTLLQSYQTYANEDNRVDPIDLMQETSLEIKLSVEDEDSVTIISEMHMEIYRVAALGVIDGSASYTSIAPFDKASIDYTQIVDATISNQAAKTLRELTGEVEGITKVTDELGTVKITNIEIGMYLVVPLGEVNGYSFEAFLISVPLAQKSSRGENVWEYQVRTKPKVGNKHVEVPTVPPISETPDQMPEPKKPDEGKPTNAPKTGDDANLQFWMAMVGITILGIVCIVVVKKKK